MPTESHKGSADSGGHCNSSGPISSIGLAKLKRLRSVVELGGDRVQVDGAVDGQVCAW
jgi:hypothetical protein